MRRTLLSILAVAILLGTSGVGLAQDALKPVVVVGFSGYDELMKDIEFVGKLGEKPDLAKGLEGMLAMVTQGKGLAGLDKAKPWGVIIQTDGQDFSVLGFVPVTDLKQIVGVLGPLAGGPPPQPGDDGVYEIATPAAKVFLVEKGGWAFLSNTREALDAAPADPSKLLAGLTDKYDVAARVLVKNLPDSARQQFVGLLQMGAEAGLQQEMDESDEIFALRSKLTKQSVQQTIRMVNELDTLLIGLTLDGEAKAAHVDMTLTAVAGTKTAEEFAKMGQLKTNFAGIALPDAAITMQSAGKMSDSDVTQLKSTLASIHANTLRELGNQGLPEDKEQKAKALLASLMEIVVETIEGKEMDAAVAIKLAPDAVTMVAGGLVADGAKLEKLLEEIATLAKEEKPEVEQLIKLNAEQHEGVNLHVISIPLPDEPDAEKVGKLIGNPIEIVIGTGPKSAYLAMGRDALSTLKGAIDKCKADAGADALPGRFSVAAGPIAKLIAATAEEEQVKQAATAIAEVLAQTPGKDHVVVSSKAVENGFEVRIEIEEGVLKMFGALSKMVPGAGGGPAIGPGF